MDKKKVLVLMSTYNGGRYLDEQIESILNQKDIDTHILIRDDGSTDGTVGKLRCYSSKYSDKIQLMIGENWGYRTSFKELLLAAKDCDFYAYADQDDVWLPKKLQKAVDTLENNHEYWIYSSGLTVTDRNLRTISKKRQDDIVQSLGSFFVRTRLAGCTMVFRRELAEKARMVLSQCKLNERGMPDHDCFLCMLCMLYKKRIYVDTNSYILHRRTSESITAGNGLISRLKVEWNRILHRDDAYYNTAGILKSLIKIDNVPCSEENLQLIQTIVEYKDNIFSTFRLLDLKGLSCGIFMADILIRIKILLRKY